MKKVLLHLALFASLLVPFAVISSQPAAAISAAPICESTANRTDACQALNAGETSENPIVRFIKIAVDILSVIIGAAAVIIIIVSGIRFMTSGGDAQGVSSAKSAIIYALIGLVVIALSQMIVRYVLNRVG